MTTISDDSRLGRLEGRVEEQSIAMQNGFQQVNARLDRLDARIDQANSRSDRMFFAMLGVSAAQIGLLITIVLRGG